MGEPPRVESGHLTYADYLSWSNDARWELIDGIAYNMTPAPSTTHQDILTRLLFEFFGFLRDKPCRVFPAPFDVRLPAPGEDEMSASTVVQPDITVVCDPDKLSERGCLGSPTLVVEILSPHTAVKDLREKFAVYQRAGVPEYWVVSPIEKYVTVYTLHAPGVYGSPSMYFSGEQVPVSMLPGLQIDLLRIFPTIMAQPPE